MFLSSCQACITSNCSSLQQGLCPHLTECIMTWPGATHKDCNYSSLYCWPGFQEAWAVLLLQEAEGPEDSITSGNQAIRDKKRMWRKAWGLVGKHCFHSRSTSGRSCHSQGERVNNLIELSYRPKKSCESLDGCTPHLWKQWQITLWLRCVK